MCEHEGQACPGSSCRCECMNCQFPEDDDETNEVTHRPDPDTIEATVDSDGGVQVTFDCICGEEYCFFTKTIDATEFRHIPAEDTPNDDADRRLIVLSNEEA